MDRNQLLNNPEISLRAALTGWQAGIWTAMPGIVQSVNLAKMTLVAQIAIQGTTTNETGEASQVDISQLVDVPICFPSAGGFLLTFPIAEGDEVLIIFASRCIDSWWQNGGYQNVPMEPRMHDLSDAFAIPGPMSQPSLAGMGAISSSDAQLRSFDGMTFVGLSGGKLIQLVNSTGSAKSVLQAMLMQLNTLNTALTTFSSACAGSVTDPVLAAAATALSPALASLTATIATVNTATIPGLFQ